MSADVWRGVDYYDLDLTISPVPHKLTISRRAFTSKVAKDVAEEVRCKALSDSALTYRFLLCRVNLIDQVSRLPRGVQALSSLGGAAYYILSDGREAGSTVKRTFEPH